MISHKLPDRQPNNQTYTHTHTLAEGLSVSLSLVYSITFSSYNTASDSLSLPVTTNYSIALPLLFLLSCAQLLLLLL